MPLTFTLYRGCVGFRLLRDDWEAFACRFGTHFLHFPAWYGAELEHSGDEGVYFLALRDRSAELVAVLPLQHRQLSFKGISVPILQIYYQSEMGVNDVLSRQPLRQHWAAICDFLRREMPFFLFMRWQCAIENGWAVTAAPSPDEIRHSHDSKFLGFPNGSQAFLECYSSKFKTGLLEKMRKLAGLGELRLEISSSVRELPTAFEHFLDVEDSGWKGQEGTSIRKQPWMEKYYRHLLEHYGRLGLCRINFLFLGETAIAAQFSIEVAECLYLLKIGFREEHSECSPGALLLYKLVLHHCENGPVKAISFVTGVPWIDRWHPSTAKVFVFYTDCGTLLSKLAVRSFRFGLRVRDHRRSLLAERERSCV
jgi:hypothetical protein